MTSTTKTIQLFPPWTEPSPLETSENKVIVFTRSTVPLSRRPAKVPARLSERIKRVITHTDRWQHVADCQDEMLPQWLSSPSSDTSSSVTAVDDAKLVHRQILNKIAGYKCQDQHKHLFDPAKFVNFTDVLTMLNTNMTCYYCKECVLVLYDFRREPRQWTLERLNNDLGHNRDNVVLSCLQCNLRRRTMLSSKYVQTQDMKHVCKLDL
jgi:hypothetical protein